MRVAASVISTQDTPKLNDIAMKVTNYMTMKCASSKVNLLTAALMTVSYAQ